MDANPNVVEGSPEPQDATDKYVASLREKILFGLSIYKFLSPTMLHTFMGTSTPAAVWKGLVLDRLIDEGLVVCTTVTLTSPSDRSQSYQVLHLAENEYVPPEGAQPTPPAEPEAAAA